MSFPVNRLIQRDCNARENLLPQRARRQVALLHDRRHIGEQKVSVRIEIPGLAIPQTSAFRRL